MKYLLLLMGLMVGTPVLAYDCAISVTPLMFGTVEGIVGHEQRSTATIRVVCRTGDTAANVNYQILIDGVSAEEGRSMGAGGHSTGYQLYTSDNYQQVWGNSGSGVVSDSYPLGVHESAERSYRIYAKMRTGRQDAPGHYQDTVNVRLQY